MKYEAVFGDQKRFNEQNNEMTEVMLWHDCLGPNFVSIKELSRMNLEGAIPHGSVVLAMRRIIAEPKRWTVEDQKAGRLPEVGSFASYHIAKGKTPTEITMYWRDGDELEIIKDLGCRLFSVFNKRAETCSNLVIDFMRPIETPEEKAQREEDEFVFLVESEYNKMPNEISFKAGIRAAYRKLKGSE